MKPDIESLLQTLNERDAKHDLQGLRDVREQIVAHHPDSEHAIEALYKLGLDSLFRERNMDNAVEKFVLACKGKDSYWALAARTSLGLCYYHQKRLQKALLELRKVAHTETPNAHSVTALTFLENIFASEGSVDEMKRVRQERIKQLQTIIAETENQKTKEHGHNLFTLALALKDSGEDNQAYDLLQEAQKLGPAVLGKELQQAIAEALRWR